MYAGAYYFKGTLLMLAFSDAGLDYFKFCELSALFWS